MKSNILFLLDVLIQPECEIRAVTAAFIDEHFQLERVSKSSWNFASNKRSDQRKVKELERCAFFTNAVLSNPFSADM